MTWQFLSGWSCFAWNNVNTENTLLDRRIMEAAGALAITTTLTGVLYLVNHFHTMAPVIHNIFARNIEIKGRKLWSRGRALKSWSEGFGFDIHPLLDGSGFKAMPGSISAPNSGSLYKKENTVQVAKWGTSILI